MKDTEKSALPKAQAQSALQARIETLEARRAPAGAAAPFPKEPPFQDEMQNPAFLRLLRAGVDARTAYDVLHWEETLRQVAKQVEKRVRARVLREAQARSARPLENGTSGRAPASLREPLPSEWSREERDRVGRAALKGRKHTIAN